MPKKPQKKAAKPVSTSFDVEMWPVDRPKDYPGNARKWSGQALAKVAASIKAFGFRQPVVVDSDEVLVVGHLRRAGAREAGLKQIPVHVARDLTAAKIRAYRLADNRTAQEADWDMDLLASEFAGLKALDFDLSLTCFNAAEWETPHQPDPELAARTLAERFGVPPFSVLDARQGYWQDRKRAWLALGIQSELGRGGATC